MVWLVFAFMVVFVFFFGFVVVVWFCEVLVRALYIQVIIFFLMIRRPPRSCEVGLVCLCWLLNRLDVTGALDLFIT